MLEELRVENLLLMDRAELRLASGLNALTGETGAGKTLLAHALDLLLGGRARKGIVRPGAAEAYVEGVFGVPSSLAGSELLPTGAQEIVLFGWSMGAAIVLQTLDRSWLSDRVTAVVLDAPVIDWADVLRHHGALHKIPGPIGSLSRSLIGHRWARRLVGVHEPIDVALTNWEHRADELKHPTLLIHSLDDEFVPAGPSISLAAKRPDLVRFEPWREARHTKEWNVDPERWDAVVRAFLAEKSNLKNRA